MSMTVTAHIARSAELASRHIVEPMTRGRVTFSRRVGLYVGPLRLVTEAQLRRCEETAYKRGKRQSWGG